MLDNFDPKEKKIIIIFMALLILGLVYVGTHDTKFEINNQTESQSLPLKNPSNTERFL